MLFRFRYYFDNLFRFRNGIGEIQALSTSNFNDLIFFSK